MKKLLAIVFFAICFIAIVFFAVYFIASMSVGCAYAEEAEQVECVEVVLPETEDCPTMSASVAMETPTVSVYPSDDNVYVTVRGGERPSVSVHAIYRGNDTVVTYDVVQVNVGDGIRWHVYGGIALAEIEYIRVRVIDGGDLIWLQWYGVAMSGKIPYLIEADDPTIEPTTAPTTTTEFTTETEELRIEPYCSEGTITVNVLGGFFPAASIMVRYAWDDTLRDWDFAYGAYYEDFCTAYTEFGLCVEHLAEVQIHAWDGFGEHLIMRYTVANDDGKLVLQETGEGRWTD